MLRAAKKSFISGRTLVVSQQTVRATNSEVSDIVSRYIDPLLAPVSHRLRPKSSHNRNSNESFEGRCSAKRLFEMLGAESVEISDVSDYENPDFLLDLNEPVDASFHSGFDTIIDSGTIEHVFDISTALHNLASMLRLGGTICLIVPSSNCLDHGFYSISPTLFYDFFGSNGFSDMSCYLREACWYNPDLKTRLWEYRFVGDQFPMTSGLAVETLFFARKVKPTPVKMIKPVQSLYRRLDDWLASSQERQSGNYLYEEEQSLLLNNSSFDVTSMSEGHLRPSSSFVAFLRARLLSVFARLSQSRYTQFVFFNFGHLMPNPIVSAYNRARRSMSNLRYLGRF